MAKETLASTVDENDIVDLGEEINPPNFLIDSNYGISGNYSDYSLVEKKVSYRTGKLEDGINNGKIIKYIKWDTTPSPYSSTIFGVINNYQKQVGLKKFKQLSKCSDFSEIKNIYLEIKSTIDKFLNEYQLPKETKEKGETVNKIDELNSKLAKVKKILNDADELEELIKQKKKIIIDKTEDKQRKHIMKLEK